MYLIPRDVDRTEHDDFVLNVQPSMGKHDGATLLYDKDGAAICWQIKPLWE